MNLFDLEDMQPALTKRSILDKYSSEAIYRAVYPDFDLNTTYAPWRQDNNPSFSFHDKSESGEVLWRDHKTSEKGDVFDFVVQYYKRVLKKNITLFDSLGIIERMMQGKPIRQSRIIARVDGEDMATTVRTKRNPPVVTAIVPAGGLWMPDFALRYWEDQRIDRNYLKMYKTQFADEIWLKRYKEGKWQMIRWGESAVNDPIFFWQFPSGNMKCYRPLSKDKKRKWLSTISKSIYTDIQGLAQCDIERRFPAVMVLAKAMKDVMLFRTFGIDAVAMHGEGYRPDAALITYLLRYCHVLISVYDNDIAGMRGGIWLRQEYLIPDFYIPRDITIKDCAELNIKNRPLLQDYILQVVEAIKYVYGIDRCTIMGIGAGRQLYPASDDDIRRRYFRRIDAQPGATSLL